MSSDCPFCHKLATLAALPASEVVWEFPHSVALLGTHQYYRGYCVLICRQHATELNGLDTPVRQAYLEEMCELARAIELAFRPHKLNYELLGNQVPHLHWHLFPRSSSDPQRLQPVWIALHQAETDSAVRSRLQGPAEERPAIRTALQEQLRNLTGETHHP